MWPLNFHFSNWWMWPQPKVNTTWNKREIKISKTREMPRGFLSLWTHLSLFSACASSRIPVAPCYCCWNSVHRWRLWTLNLSLSVEPGLWVLAFYPCPPSVFEWMLLALLFKCFKAQRSSLLSRCQSVQRCSVIQGQLKCRRLALSIAIYMSFTLFQGQ